MGLLTNRVDRKSLKAGDHIYSWRAGYVYAHHGIYVEDNNVIHFTRRGQEVGTGTVLDILLVSSSHSKSYVPCPTCIPPEEGHGVLSSCLDCFLAGGILCRFEYNVNPALFLAKLRGGTCTLAVSDPGDVVVRRAKYLLDNGFGSYNVFNNNCEDFTIYCKTGLVVMDKVIIGQSGQVMSLFSAPFDALKATLRSANRNPYGLAVMAVTAYCVSRLDSDIGRRKGVVKLEPEELTKSLAHDPPVSTLPSA